jgi:hypothetical protein
MTKKAKEAVILHPIFEQALKPYMPTNQDVVNAAIKQVEDAGYTPIKVSPGNSTPGTSLQDLTMKELGDFLRVTIPRKLWNSSRAYLFEIGRRIETTEAITELTIYDNSVDLARIVKTEKETKYYILNKQIFE